MVFIVIWSLGDHIIFAVEGPIGLKLSKGGKEGRRLGQFGGARNLGTILGVGVDLSPRALPRRSLRSLLRDRRGLRSHRRRSSTPVSRSVPTDPPSRRLVFKRRYSIFYAISALFGIRKQIFLAFGVWVLVEIHDVPVSTIALLYFIAATLGVVFRPLLGEVVDWLGERTVLAADELLLLVICLAYAFASDLLAAALRSLAPLRRLHLRQRALRPADRPHDLSQEDRRGSRPTSPRPSPPASPSTTPWRRPCRSCRATSGRPTVSSGSSCSPAPSRWSGSLSVCGFGFRTRGMRSSRRAMGAVPDTSGEKGARTVAMTVCDMRC